MNASPPSARPNDQPGQRTGGPAREPSRRAGSSARRSPPEAGRRPERAAARRATPPPPAAPPRSASSEARRPNRPRPRPWRAGAPAAKVSRCGSRWASAGSAAPADLPEPQQPPRLPRREQQDEVDHAQQEDAVGNVMFEQPDQGARSLAWCKVSRQARSVAQIDKQRVKGGCFHRGGGRAGCGANTKSRSWRAIENLSRNIEGASAHDRMAARDDEPRCRCPTQKAFFTRRRPGSGPGQAAARRGRAGGGCQVILGGRQGSAWRWEGLHPKHRRTEEAAPATDPGKVTVTSDSHR